MANIGEEIGTVEFEPVDIPSIPEPEPLVLPAVLPAPEEDPDTVPVEEPEAVPV